MGTNKSDSTPKQTFEGTKGINYNGIEKLIKAVEDYNNGIKSSKKYIIEIKESAIKKAVRGDKSVKDLQDYIEAINTKVTNYVNIISNYENELHTIRENYVKNDISDTNAYTIAKNNINNTTGDE